MVSLASYEPPPLDTEATPLGTVVPATLSKRVLTLIYRRRRDPAQVTKADCGYKMRR